MHVGTLEQLHRIAAAAQAAGDVTLAAAGKSVAMPASQGLAMIANESRKGAAASGVTPTGTLGLLAGLTLVKNSAAFTAPEFRFANRSEKNGYKRSHFAKVLPTRADDVTHDSFYPGPGDHVRTGMTTRVGGRIVQYYWRISPAVSEKIRQGEEEHLADARRAWELSYKLVADAINSLAGKEFCSTVTPGDAEKQAKDALDKLLPLPLRGAEANWPKVLDRLLQQTTQRDTDGWHSVSAAHPKQIGDKMIMVVDLQNASIGQHGASSVVNY